MTETATIFVANLRAERARRKLSQAELAEKIGMTRQTVSRIERGDACVSLDTLHAVASALCLAPDQLIRPAA